jgi:5-methyltetrahydropteroyltriglutamate--homocysteine methyltransferase
MALVEKPLLPRSPAKTFRRQTGPESPSRSSQSSFPGLLSRDSTREREQIGVHTCPGGDRDSTDSADVDYADLLPFLFRLNVGRFYIQLASESEPRRVLGAIRKALKPEQILFGRVTDPINPRVETPEQVRDRIHEAGEFIPIQSLGTTDDCGFSPFADDTSTLREIAFAKVRSRVEGTRLASSVLESAR